MVRQAVFVVEDDGSVRRALSRLLRRAGFEVETFETAEDYLLSTLPEPACLVIDVHLPGMNGIELQRHLSGGLGVVTISGHGGRRTRTRALEAGAAVFLDKPFTETAMLDAIAQAMAKT